MSFANTVLYARATPPIGVQDDESKEEEIHDGESPDTQSLLQEIAGYEE